jgi:hypothetical protein
MAIPPSPRRLLNTTTSLTQDEAEELQPHPRRAQLGLVGMGPQLQADQWLFQPFPRTPQLLLGVPKQHQIVTVPDVAGHAPAILHQMVDRVQQHIRQELAGQMADGNPVRPTLHALMMRFFGS